MARSGSGTRSTQAYSSRTAPTCTTDSLRPGQAATPGTGRREMEGGHQGCTEGQDESWGHHAAAHPGEKHPCSGDAGQAGQRVPVEGGMAKGCPTNMGQPALGPGCEAEAGLVACGIPQWPGAAGHLPLPAPASSSSSTPGSSVGNSSRFHLSTDPATERGVKTLAGMRPVGTAWARSRLADAHPAAPSTPAPPAPRAHGSEWGSPTALWVPIAAPWLQEGY